jgi:hypothetical protein
MTCLRLLAFGLLCLPSCTVSAAPESDLVNVSTLDEEAVREAILQRVKTSIASNDFAGLSAMENDFRSSRARTPSGLWKLAVFHAGVQAYLAPGLQRENGCKYQKQQFLRQWSAASPTNPAPVITDAALLLKQAWCIRGPGYADEVEQPAWPQFRISVAAASQALAERSAMASADPEYYAVKLEALRSEGAGLEATQAVLEEATEREPYYHRTYFNAAWSYLPQWGGSFAEVERLARYAAAKTRPLEGDGYYARLFWSLEDCGCEIMEQTADRAMLKQAMRDVYNRYPVRWNGQYNADISCRLGEVEEGRRYLRALHPEATGEGDFVALFASCEQAKTSS